MEICQTKGPGPQDTSDLREDMALVPLPQGGDNL